jgi:hypothetical protein
MLFCMRVGLREERVMSLFGNWVLREILGNKRVRVKVQCGRLHKEQLCDLHCCLEGYVGE